MREKLKRQERAAQFRIVIHDVLEELNLALGGSPKINGVEAEELLLGTGIAESLLIYRRQKGGNALGLLQMEPATHSDIWVRYLRKHQRLGLRILEIVNNGRDFKYHIPSAELLANNDRYSVLMARVYYLRIPAPLPKSGDTQAQAQYWKTYYNTREGKGTVEKYVRKWGSFCGKETALSVDQSIQI